MKKLKNSKALRELKSMRSDHLKEILKKDEVIYIIKREFNTYDDLTTKRNAIKIEKAKIKYNKDFLYNIYNTFNYDFTDSLLSFNYHYNINCSNYTYKHIYIDELQGVYDIQLKQG